ncbi:hypothetical protein SCLCIDRAFT_18870 [Scleroderma citrinum Foug A]|uniref:Uncharacterized protein n=1 Tax=Scleroderma citrinum Foug A TaxID=1036808 RepID=A0A0C3ESR8_9AGAM|nr:hypothetical protein SCLCIDRAFT_18870 [Scleroderma citrinum Foug A]
MRGSFALSTRPNANVKLAIPSASIGAFHGPSDASVWFLLWFNLSVCCLAGLLAVFAWFSMLWTSMRTVGASTWLATTVVTSNRVSNAARHLYATFHTSNGQRSSGLLTRLSGHPLDPSAQPPRRSTSSIHRFASSRRLNESLAHPACSLSSGILQFHLLEPRLASAHRFVAPVDITAPLCRFFTQCRHSVDLHVLFMHSADTTLSTACCSHSTGSPPPRAWRVG